MSKYLRRHAQKPELILCSPAARTQETLTLMRPALSAATVLLEDGLYGASRDELLARIRRVADTVSSVMLIGHNPGLHELALALASAGDDLPRLEEKFPAGALATLTIAGAWEQLAPASAVLAALVAPKHLS
jgi:phosphohistidine phosphatase